jgi:SAM-dependent methyltransferase
LKEDSLNENASTLAAAVKNWWREQRRSTSFLASSRMLMTIVVEFLRDSLPDRRRQRFGDVDYDWEYRVDTTSANIGWRARLIGLLNSPYQPIEAALLREILNQLAIDFAQFTFVDIGSGKGRALLLAAEYPFRKIVGVELLPELNEIALDNIRRFSARHTQCGLIDAVCGDATELALPAGPLVLLLNNPLPAAGLQKFISQVTSSLRQEPRPVWLIYANPTLEYIVSSTMFRKTSGTHQYSIFES